MTLEHRLRDLAAELAYPPTPELEGPVLARLEERPVPAWRLAPRVALVAAVVAALAVVTVAVVPPARDAVADLLGIGRVEVEVVPELPPVAADLQLGRQVTLAEARAAAPAPVPVPAELGAPDAVYLAPDGIVTLAWAPRPGLPDVAGTGVGALLSVLPEPGVIIAKQITIETQPRSVVVAGEPGLFLEGGPHVVFLEPQPGDAVESRGRLAGNTLLWERGEATLRLEADVALDDALRIAESLE